MRPIDADEIEYLYPMIGFSAYVNEEDVEKIPTLDVVPREYVDSIKSEIANYMNAYKLLIDNDSPVRESKESLKNRVNTYKQCLDTIDKYINKIREGDECINLQLTL